jgi:hypothetical protein
MRYVTICPEAWKLYDAWMAALGQRPARQSDVQIAQKAYYDHRENCPLCSPVVKDAKNG